MPRKNQNLFAEPLLRNKPASDEIEVTLLGKGVGECVVLHLGSGHYVTIDSFINPETKNPIVLDYIESIGASKEDIDCVVVTHWHKDHVLGIAKLAEVVSSKARFVMPAVIKDEFFTKFLNINDNQLNDQSPSAEFHSALTTIMTRHLKIVLATNDKLIFGNDEGSRGNVNLFSLSPNDEQLLTYLSFLKKAIDAQVKRPSFIFSDDNSISTALWLDFLNDKVLLGGDLLKEGWKVIVENREIKGVASLFKVPHHGSITGHHESVWSHMLTGNPTSLLSVYAPSGLPTDTDKARIKTLSKRMLVVGAKAKVENRPDFFNKLKRCSTVKLRPLCGTVGLVRARKHIGDALDWTIECFGKVEDLR